MARLLQCVLQAAVVVLPLALWLLFVFHYPFYAAAILVVLFAGVMAQ